MCLVPNRCKSRVKSEKKFFNNFFNTFLLDVGGLEMREVIRDVDAAAEGNRWAITSDTSRRTRYSS